ncbi:hypothetical protein AB8B21_18245 [Tardiphaga sp. 866_E4_N2_1]|uniref:hypothetical protein n=1 Tax=unclassified Tardiphaga TaxID=2631404 RepID=UPI003F206CAD
METKDFWTLGLALLALAVSTSSAIYQYVKDQKAERESRLPVIAISVSRPGIERHFALRFQFQNKEYADATINSVTLISPNGYHLGAATQPVAENARDRVPVPGFDIVESRFKPLTLPVNNGETIPRQGQATWFCYVVVPEEAALPRGTIVYLDVKLRLRDNEDREVTVRRFAKLID